MDWETIEPALKQAFFGRINLATSVDFLPQIRRILGRKNMLIRSASSFKTPQYLLDESVLRSDALLFKRTFQKYFKRCRFFYAFKCNDLPYQISVLQNLGFDADVASSFELQLALRLGFKRIIYTSPGKSEFDLKFALRHSDKVIINIDNYDELERLIRLKAKCKVSFRITPVESKWSKFGFLLEDLRSMVNKATGAGLKFTGIHFHSSWNKTPGAYVANIKAIGSCLKAFTSKEKQHLDFLDIGGGFLPPLSASYFCNTDKGKLLSIASQDFDERLVCLDKLDSLETFAKEISSALREAGLTDIELWLEPGRFVVSNATIILAKVICRKSSSVITDAGIHMLGGANADFEFFPIVNLSRPSFSLRKSTIYGPLCDPDDLWGYYYFGTDIKVGDTIAIATQGAYTYATAWKFINPIPKYVVLKGNKLFLAKKEETFNERFRSCVFPNRKLNPVKNI